jgi:hypothetical protein
LESLPKTTHFTSKEARTVDEIIQKRISRIYAAVDAAKESDLGKLQGRVIQTPRVSALFQDFRGGLSQEQLSNQAHLVIHNIANLRDHLRRWAAQKGLNRDKVDQTVKSSFELQVIQDLSNNDKHGYPPRDGGCSGKAPQLGEVTRVLRLCGSGVATFTGGAPQITGDSTAEAVVTAEIFDQAGGRIGDLHDVAAEAVSAWEKLLKDFNADLQRLVAGDSTASS